MNKEKPRLRLLDAIEKQRKILSANSEASVNVDNIVEDEDLSYNLTRDNFEDIIAPILQKFQNALLNLKSEIKIPIHSVEIAGGGTRIPIVQRIIQEVFKCECLRTLNASECVARGCAIQSVLLNPLYKGAPYIVEDSNYHPIACSWTFKHEVGKLNHHQYKNDPSKQFALLFPKGSPVPCAKGLTFHRDADIDVKLFYADPAPPGADQLIAQYYVHGQKARTHDFGIKVVVALNKYGLSELESAKLLEDVYEDKLAPGGHRAQSRGGFGFGSMGGFFQQQEEEVKKKKQTYSADLKAEVSNFNVMDQRIVDELANYENKMAQQDRLIQETYEKRNELEAFVYDIRNKLNDKYDQFIKPEAKANFLQNLNDVENWLYGDGAKASKMEYQAKLDQIRAVVSMLEKRYKDFDLIPQYISQFANNLTSTEQLLTSQQGSSVSGQDKTQLLEAINNNKGWLEEVNRRLSTANRMEDPPVSSDEIQNRMREFMNVRTTGGFA
jgi:heat shock protein 4